MQFHLMKELAKRHPESEICGFTVNVDGIDSILPVPNVHYQPEHNFAMHAELQNLYLNAAMEQITGMYHSHNNGSCVPSKGDLAAWPSFEGSEDWNYYIVANGEVWNWELVDGEPVGRRVDQT